MDKTTGIEKVALVIILFAFLYLFGHLMFALGRQQTMVTNTPTNMVRCEEDMPCWNCETMGNLICGKETDINN